MEARNIFAQELRGLKVAAEERLGRRLTYDEIAAAADVSRHTAKDRLDGRRIPSSRHDATKMIEACDPGGTNHEGQLKALEAWTEARRKLEQLQTDYYQTKLAIYPNEGEEIGGIEDAGERGSFIEDVTGLLVEGGTITKFTNNSQFYTAALRQAEDSRSHIRVTYIRQFPPAIHSKAAKEYFSGLLTWAASDNTRQLRRVIGVPTIDGKPNSEFLRWVKSHNDETESIHNYEKRILTWTNEADGLNMAIMDESTSFIAVSDAGRTYLWGGRIQSRNLNEMLRFYFDQLWHNLEPIEKYLSRIGSTNVLDESGSTVLLLGDVLLTDRDQQLRDSARRRTSESRGVFVSYVRDDIDEVNVLCTALQAAGVKIWRDLDQLLPGDDWKDTIRHAIKNGIGFLACFSKHSEVKEESFMREEIALAFEQLRLRPADSGWFIPVMLTEGPLPNARVGDGRKLTDFQFLRWYEDRGKSLRLLLASIDRLRAT
jgi:hypothetical protein